MFTPCRKRATRKPPAQSKEKKKSGKKKSQASTTTTAAAAPATVLESDESEEELESEVINNYKENFCQSSVCSFSFKQIQTIYIYIDEEIHSLCQIFQFQDEDSSSEGTSNHTNATNSMGNCSSSTALPSITLTRPSTDQSDE